METTATTLAVINQPTLTKTCSKCGKSLPVTEFAKHSRAKDGLQSWCKDCTKKANAESYARRKAKISTPPPISANHEPTIFEQMNDREVIAEIRERIEHLRNHGWMFEGQLKYIQERIVKL